jgi:hypothetical protein
MKLAAGSKKPPVPVKKSPSSSAGSKKATFLGKKTTLPAFAAKKDAGPVRKSPSSTVGSKKAGDETVIEIQHVSLLKYVRVLMVSK